MFAEALRKKLDRGETVLSTMLFMARNPRWMAGFRSLGFDAIFVDNEHAAFSRSETATLVAMVDALGMTPLVRIPTAVDTCVNMALDAGAHGILAPYCETAEQVREIVGAARLRPIKGMLRGEVTGGRYTLTEETEAYLEQFNRNPYIMIGIESEPALANLDEIVDVEGIDTVFVGPHDLTISLGIPNQYDHPDYEMVLQRILGTCLQAGISVAIHSGDPQAAARWINEGARFVIFGSDTTALATGYRQGLTTLKSMLEDDSDTRTKPATMGIPEEA